MKKIILILTIILFLALIFFPIYIMLKISLSSPSEIFQIKPPYLIKQATFKHFMNVFNSGEAFWMPLKKSIIVGIGVCILSLFIGIPAAYAISRFNMRIRYLFMFVIFMSRMLPEVSIALPISIQFIKLGLFDTDIGLILAHLIKALPVSTFILINVFSHFPKDLEEQALTDGCSRIQAITKVILPLSLGGIVVAGVFAFLLSWDEFIYASYLSLTKPTMPLKIYYYVARGNVFYSASYAIIITLPVLLVTFLIHKHIKSEYLSGSIKG